MNIYYLINKYDEIHIDTIFCSISSAEYLTFLKDWKDNSFSSDFWEVNLKKCSWCGRHLTERWRKYIRLDATAKTDKIDINNDVVACYCNTCGQNKLYGLLLAQYKPEKVK